MLNNQDHHKTNYHIQTGVVSFPMLFLHLIFPCFCLFAAPQQPILTFPASLANPEVGTVDKSLNLHFCFRSRYFASSLSYAFFTYIQEPTFSVPPIISIDDPRHGLPLSCPLIKTHLKRIVISEKYIERGKNWIKKKCQRYVEYGELSLCVPR